MSNESNVRASTLRIDAMDLYPLQGAFYHPCTAGEDEAVEQELRRDGQRDPIVLLPANRRRGRPKPQILDGRRRHQLLRKIGQGTVKVVFRHDLADADDATVEEAFLRYNFSRRQLSILEKGRIALRLIEIEQDRPSGGLRPGYEQPEARDRVGRILGMSGRHLSRVFRVLLTPVEIQRAVEAGCLPLILAERVEGLSTQTRTALAASIRGLTDAREITRRVADAVGAGTPQQRRADELFDRLASHLAAGVRNLESRAEQINVASLHRMRPTMERAVALLTKLLAACRT